MPQLDKLLELAQNKQTKKSYSRGNRPDRIASSSILIPEADLEEKNTPIKVEPKLESKWSQTEAKVEPKLESKWSQTEAKVEPKNRPKIETRVKVEPEPEPKLESKWSQTEAKVEPKLEISSVVGLQRDILIFLYKSCRFSGSKLSPKFAIQNISDGSKSTISSAKKALQRLEKKRLIQRGEYKDGRNGWTRYLLPDRVYAELFQEESEAKVESNWSQSRAKVEPKPEPKPEPTPPSSSSSSLLINTTTTNDADRQQISPEWEKIGIELLAEVGFKKSHLLQIIRFGSVTPEQLQDSIDAFIFDLEENDKSSKMKTLPLNYFMGVLRNGPYAPPANYESPKDKQLREYLEAKEKEQKARLELEARLEIIEFNDWIAGLTVEDKIKLVPATDFAKPGSQGHNVQLKEYFRESVWPELRKEKRLKPEKKG